MSSGVILGVKPFIYCHIAMTVFGTMIFLRIIFQSGDILVNTDFVPAAKGIIKKHYHQIIPEIRKGF